MDWKTLLAYITGSVDQELLLRTEYLAAENGILRNQITGCVHLRDAERTTLAEIGKKLGKQALAEALAVTCEKSHVNSEHPLPKDGPAHVGKLCTASQLALIVAVPS